MKSKKNITILSIILVCSLIIGSFIYYKKVQAGQLANNFRSSMQQRDYVAAKQAYEKANNDIIIKNLFSFNTIAKSLVSSNLLSLKEDYFNNKISFKQFNEYSTCLCDFECSDNVDTKFLHSDIKKIEDARQAYINAESQYNNKNYPDALNTLNSISINNDVLSKKVNSLKQLVISAHLKEINPCISSLMDKGQYTNALVLLNNNKSFFNTSDFKSKFTDINVLVLKNLLAQNDTSQKINRGENTSTTSFLTSLLSEHIDNPVKENAVKNEQSNTIFLMSVDLASQTTDIFIGQKGNWNLVKSYSCSTGKPGDDTPKGTFTVNCRGLWFFNPPTSEGAQYWTQFYGGYLFHSFPMNENKQITDTTLGKPASHGCVRLETSNAKWIYDNIPNETKVIIK